MGSSSQGEEGIFYGTSLRCNILAAVGLSRKHPELGRLVVMINDSESTCLLTEVFGVKKRLVVPETEHELGHYSMQQLKLHID